MTVNFDEYSDPFVISADDLSVRINVLINAYNYIKVIDLYLIVIKIN